jgi:hypothetical protein
LGKEEQRDLIRKINQNPMASLHMPMILDAVCSYRMYTRA